MRKARVSNAPSLPENAPAKDRALKRLRSRISSSSQNSEDVRSISEQQTQRPASKRLIPGGGQFGASHYTNKRKSTFGLAAEIQNKLGQHISAAGGKMGAKNRRGGVSLFKNLPPGLTKLAQKGSSDSESGGGAARSTLIKKTFRKSSGNVYLPRAYQKRTSVFQIQSEGLHAPAPKGEDETTAISPHTRSPNQSSPHGA